MKNNMLKLPNKVLTFLLLFGIYTGVNSQDNRIDEEYKWNINIKNVDIVDMNNYSCDLSIENHNSNEAIFKINLIAKSSDSKNIEKLKDYFDKLDFKSSGNKLILNTNFFNKVHSINTGFVTSVKLEFKDGEEIKLSEFKISAKLMIPSNMKIELKSKYSKINLEDLEKLNLNSYDDRITAGDVKKEFTLKAKYSKLGFKNLPNSEINIYNSKLNAVSLGKCNIVSKYSKINILNCGEVSSNSYNDKYELNKTGNLHLKSKYTGYKSEVAKSIEIDSFDSDFVIYKSDNVSISNSKYSTYKFENSGNISVGTSFDDAFKTKSQGVLSVGTSKYSEYETESGMGIKVNTSFDDKFSVGSQTFVDVGKSKYSEYYLSMIKNYINVDGFDDVFKIIRASKDFKNFTVKGKYQKIKLNIPKSLGAKVQFDGKYGKFKYDESMFDVKKHIEKSTKTDITISRKDKKESAEIVVQGYDCKFELDVD